MNVQEAMNAKYSELCQKLGSLAYQQALLQGQITEVQAQIKALNELAPTMRKIELQLKADNGQKDTDARPEKTITAAG